MQLYAVGSRLNLIWVSRVLRRRECGSWLEAADTSTDCSPILTSKRAARVGAQDGSGAGGAAASRPGAGDGGPAAAATGGLSVH